MPTRYIAATGGVTTGDASTPGTAWTMSHANANMTLGDTIIPLAGTYTTTFNPTVSPAQESQRITIQPQAGATVIFRKAALEAKRYFAFSSIVFSSVKASVVSMSSTSGRNIFEFCTFESSPDLLAEAGWSYSLVELFGDWNIFRHNVLTTWYGGDYVRVEGHHHHLHDNDARFADAGHHIFAHKCSDCVTENNKYRNQWARPTAYVVGAGDSEQGWNLHQRNSFFYCNWNGSTPPWLNKDQDGDGPGDSNLSKMCNTQTITRGDLWIYPQAEPATNLTLNYRTIWQFQNFSAENLWSRYNRIYHNTVVDNELHTVSATMGAETATLDAHDNRMFNNVLHFGVAASDPNQVPNSALWLKTTNYTDSSGSLSWLTDWWFDHNLTNGPVKYGTAFQGSLYNASGPQDPGGIPWSRGLYTLTEFYNANIANTRTDGRIEGNIAASPVFVNDDYSGPLATRANWIVWDNFRLLSGNGKNAARAIATIPASGTNVSTITVSDAYAFWPNERVIGGVTTPSVIPGDNIIITGALGTRTAQVKRIVSATSLQTMSPVTVQSGDEIWLEMFGTSPDLGIASIASDAEESLEFEGTVTLLTTKVSGTALSSLTTDAIAPAANSTLVVTIGYNHNIGANPTPIIDSITTTLANVGAWTKQAESLREGTTDTCIATFTAAVGASPGIGTITANAINSTPTEWGVAVVQITAANNSAPVLQAIAGNSASSTPGIGSGNGWDASTPGNLTLAFINGLAVPDLDIAPGAGFVELFDINSSASGHVQLQGQYAIDSGIATINWAGVHISGNAYLALEIVAAAGQLQPVRPSVVITVTGDVDVTVNGVVLMI